MCYWKRPVNIVAVENGKGREFFCNLVQQKDSIDSGETLRNKKLFSRVVIYCTVTFAPGVTRRFPGGP